MKTSIKFYNIWLSIELLNFQGAVKCLFLDWCFFCSVGLFSAWHFGAAWSPLTSARLWLAGWDEEAGICVSARHTSPTFSWRHCSLQVWLVCWGLQEDQPWPQTKKGSPSLTSSDNCRENVNILKTYFSRKWQVWHNFFLMSLPVFVALAANELAAQHLNTWPVFAW